MSVTVSVREIHSSNDFYKDYHGQGWHHGPNSKLNPSNKPPIDDSDVARGMRDVRSQGCHGEPNGYVGLHGKITLEPDSDDDEEYTRRPVKVSTAPTAMRRDMQQQVAQQASGKQRKAKVKGAKRAKSWFSWFLR